MEQLVPHRFGVDELREERADRVERDASRAALLNGMFDARHQSSQVVRTGDERILVELRRRVHEDPATVLLPLRYVPPERLHVLADVVGGLLESDEDPGVAAL